MNSFGRLFRISVFGESHGPVVGICIDGCPPGISLDVKDFTADIERRKGNRQPGTTPRSETDEPQFISGIFNGRSTGAPLVIAFANSNTRSSDYEQQRAVPRPGHADFVAAVKFNGFEDYRGGGHFSGRLTVCLVAAGVVAKKIIEQLQIEGKPIHCRSRILEVGGNANIEEAVKTAIDKQDSIGGIVECETANLPIGLGEPFFDSVESLISHAVFSIPAIKGIEFGAGFRAARMYGSEHNDALLDREGTLATNHAGGVVGGITNGGNLVYRVVVKPTSSTPRRQDTFNKATGKVEPFEVKGRHDLCIALRVPVVLEAVTSCVVADLLMIRRTQAAG